MTTMKARDEILLINKFFADHRLGARVAESLSFVAGKSFAVFGITLGPRSRISSIESRLPELAEALSALRGAPAPVRLRKLPLALEVPHPAMAPLAPGPGALIVKPCQMLIGRGYGYDGEREHTLDLTEVAHAMVAGTTGSGKSTLVSLALTTLIFNTSPADVRLVLIDLKNEDLTAFETMPHTVMAAYSMSDAIRAIQWVHDEKELRVASREYPRQRIVLVIDELAELARDRDVMRLLASILATGRSKGVHVIAATQKPLAAIVGSVAKANFSTRLVGRVLSAEDARVAAGMPGTGAEFLPGIGSFLRIEGAQVDRIQVYHLGDAADGLLRHAASRWCKQLPLLESVDAAATQTEEAAPATMPIKRAALSQPITLGLSLRRAT